MEWPSVSTSRHHYVFKQGRVQRRRKNDSALPKTDAAQETASPATQDTISTPAEELASPTAPNVTQSDDTISPTPSLPLEGAGSEEIFMASEELNDVTEMVSLDPLDSFDGFPPLSIDFDLPFLSNGCDMSDSTLPPPLHPTSVWSREHAIPAANSMTGPYMQSCSSIVSLSPTPTLEFSELLKFYERELCTLPLTHDFVQNPFRCSSGSLQGPKALLHALLAHTLQHLTRLDEKLLEGGSISRQIATYQQSARHLCTDAVTSASPRNANHLLDTTLMLFALDTLQSSMGSWSGRLQDAYQKFEAIGGPRSEVPLSRSYARLMMFIWWDSNIALLSRTGSIFPQSYYDFVLSSDGEDAWTIIFALSGVPKELFQFIKELTELAREREQVSKLKHAIFDPTRALELEQALRAYSIGSLDDQTLVTGDENTIQSWHDYYHASNAWKYAFLLYIARVLRWDRSTSTLAAEVSSLSRMVLDSVRCCRAESSLQKQLLLPVFLAGSEAADAYSKSFVGDYCETWYQKCRYSMFREAATLLQEIWVRRSVEENKFAVWWGGVIDSEVLTGRGFLFG